MKYSYQRIEVHEHYIIKGYEFAQNNDILAVTFVNDSKFLRLYKPAKAQLLRDIRINSQISCFKIVQNQKKEEICFSDSRGFLYIYDLQKGKKRTILRPHQSEISSMDYYKEGNQLATACTKGYISVLNLSNYTTLNTIFTGHTTDITSYRFSLNEKDKFY